MVQLRVIDTGLGMTKEVMARLFEPFFTTRPAGQGTGLGLATVHRIVKECGGTMAVTSEPDRGTTFQIELPVVDKAAPLESVRGTRRVAAKVGDNPGSGR